MTKISVPVTVNVDVEIDFPEGNRSSMPGFHMEYATIDDELCDIKQVNVSAVMPTVYWLSLRRAPEPFSEKPHQITPQINFGPVLEYIVNEWPAIMKTAMFDLNNPEEEK